LRRSVTPRCAGPTCPWPCPHAQVCRQRLYDRCGTRGELHRTLITAEDIAHYQHIVAALKETMRLMGEIDEVIGAHGGWPIE